MKCNNNTNTLYLPFIIFVLGWLALSVTGNNFDLVNFHEIRHLPELYVVKNKRPHVVTEPVGVQRTLVEREEPRRLKILKYTGITGDSWYKYTGSVQGRRLWTHPEVDPVADSVGERHIDCFIELKEDLKSQLRSDLLGLNTHTQTS